MLKIIVIGGGLAGLSSAIAFSRSGHVVTLLEARDTFTELGAGIQMPPNATRIMESWGLMGEVRSRGILPKIMAFRSYRGRVLHNVQLLPDLEAAFGSPYVYIHRKELLNILVDEARRLGATLQVDRKVVRIDVANRTIYTEKGETFTADLIIGADGENSLCRQQLLGISNNTFHPTSKLVYRFVVDPDIAHHEPQLRELFDPPTITCWMGPSSHAVAYEIPHNNIVNVALTCPDPVPGRVQLGPRKADHAELRTFFADWHWDPLFLKLIDASKHILYWTLLQLPEANRVWVDDTVVIIGDAAHAMPPYLGQGAAQAIEDAAFLEHLFPSNTRPDEIPSLLAIFCERRQSRTLSIREKADKAGEILQMHDGPDQVQRDGILIEGEVTEGFPVPFADPAMQRWLYDYDVKEDATVLQVGGYLGT
ncbi:hypothetical protein GGS20DRAFT_577549 [Poronia punctata]|nr:hypothetical protein GGS20DRAFT_577549 [Poronia punctata]